MIIINGSVNADENVILDNGFFFGRGVFETILVKDEPLFLKQHCERLKAGLDVLNIKNHIGEEYILNCINLNNIHNCVLKVAVTEKNIVISTRQSPYKSDDYERGFKVKLSTLRRNPYSHVTYLKSLNYTDNILEKEQAARAGFDEVLFLNSHNELAEGSVANVFFVKDNKIYTPEIRCGILDGIIRRWVLNNFEVNEGRYSLDDIRKANEVFLTNSVMGIMKVKAVDGINSFEDCTIYSQIRSMYEKYICRQNDK